jgi:iron complex outermembrane recepter protein
MRMNAGGLAVALLATTAQAQTAPEQSAAGEAASSALTEIVVTARRYEERAQDVPISLQVYNQDQLDSRNVIGPEDLSIYTPSLSVDDRNGSDNVAFSIRGFSQSTQTLPTVAVYFGDAVFPRGGALQNAGSGGGPGSFFDLANVQVLNGPQGTLFGRNTSGGAVLLVPKKPTSQFEGYVEGAYGNFDMGRVQAVLNLPLSDRVRLRLGVDHETRDGFLQNTSGIGPRDLANVDFTSARVGLVVDITPQLENYLIGTYTLSINNGAEPQLFACHIGTGLGTFCPSQFGLSPGTPAPYPQRPYTVQNDVPGAESYFRQYQIVDTATWHATDNLSVKNILNYGQLRTVLNSDFLGTNFNIAGFPIYTAISDASALGRDAATTDQYTFSEELQLQGEFLDHRLTWQAGGYLERSGPLGDVTGSRSAGEINCTNLAALQCFDLLGTATGTPVGTVTDSVGRTFYSDLAGFAQASYALTSQLKFTAGGRYTSDSMVGIGNSPGYIFPTPAQPIQAFCLTGGVGDCKFVARENSHAPTWLFNLDYTPIDNLLLYGKYSRGYRQGGVVPTSPTANIFGPERVNNYEIGEKTTFHGPVSGTFNVSAFYNDLDNQQLLTGFLNVTNGAAVSGIINGGKSHLYGVDVDSTLNPVRSLTLGLNYSYLATRLLSLTVPAAPGYVVIANAAAGTPLPYAPKNKGTAYGSWALPIPDTVGQLSLGAAWSYVGRTFIASNTPFGTDSSYSLLNLNLNWNSIFKSPVDAELFVTNATNKLYYTNGTQYYLNFGFEDRYVGEPRMYGVRVKVRFGT